MPNSYIPEALKHAVCEVCGQRCIPMADGIDYPDGKGGTVDLDVCHRCDSQKGILAYEEALAKRS